MKLYNPKRISC